MTTPHGYFLTFEGIDGCGKSTQARLVATALGAHLTREPGATALGATLRRLALNPQSNEVPAPRTEALLMIADRAQHIAEVVRPTIESGVDVVSDRFSLSTLAYQGYGRGLDLKELGDLTTFATGGFRPDLTVVLDVSLETAATRRDTLADRMESSGPEFFARVRDGFLSLAKSDRNRVIVIDASGSLDEVTSEVMNRLIGRLPGDRSAKLTDFLQKTPSFAA